ncbi:hypothetical protein [Nostoc sp. GT001]|uniref:hypothetical protein n=1 Tax=Nostoc sp. GT001 TaxID=3056647 RepID=UPI0025AB090C|nr:hypothetical protein [Nostoc sp. GT001]MDM9585556.1 hypothetical protein [Nostoc sp. GT001]
MFPSLRDATRTTPLRERLVERTFCLRKSITATAIVLIKTGDRTFGISERSLHWYLLI